MAKQNQSNSQTQVGQDTSQYPTSYEKVNAYTKRPAFQQMVAIILFSILLILHSIFIAPPIVAVSKHAVLIFLLALHYCLIVMIAVDYIILTCLDPVDSLVCQQALVTKQKPQDIRFCQDCKSFRFIKSYHCKICQRCTQDFDHHCRYLNNCVGGKNYQSFFRILVVLTLYFVNIIVQGVWIFVYSFQNQQMNDYMISKWPILVIWAIVLFLLLGVESLLIYHLYLNFVRHMTTVQYIFRDTSSNQSSSQSSQNVNQSLERVNSCSKC